MPVLPVLLLFLIACSFPEALIRAIRAEDLESAAGPRLWACLSFGASLVLLGALLH